MKNLKFFVLGAPKVGKTSILQKLVFANQSQDEKYPSTIEDVYFTVIDNSSLDKNNSNREGDRLLFFDVAGIGNNIDIESVRNYLAYADGFILIYSINDRQTFNIVDNLKKLIDQSKDKKDIPIIALGNKLDLDDERQVDFDEAHIWAKREHIKLFEVTSLERKTLSELIMYLATRLTACPTQSTSAFKLRRSKTNQNSSGIIYD